MDALTKMTIEEDLALEDSSASRWEVKRDEPEIRQIFGHFLPLPHRALVRGLVAKDFNFPPPRHKSANALGLDELHEISERIGNDTIVSLPHRIRVRPEGKGAVVYTPYYNGFYLNEKAYGILGCCARGMSVEDTVSTTGLDSATVQRFLARALTLGLVDVCSA